MTRDELFDKRAAAETRFNELSKQKAEIDSELLRLQGEYRSYTSLIETMENDALEGEVVADANTIIAEPAEKNK